MIRVRRGDRVTLTFEVPDRERSSRGAVVCGRHRLVGTPLVAAVLFNTAVAIRQQGGELERLSDWTTWCEQSFDDGSVE